MNFFSSINKPRLFPAQVSSVTSPSPARRHML